MKKRLLGILLVVAMLLVFPANVLAADPEGMTDISGHWAEDSIVWAMEQNLFYGITDTTFAPNGTMTRGMFVTVLGRMAGIDSEDYTDWYVEYLFSDVKADSYYAPYINWAVRMGIASGMGGGKFSPDSPVTREQIAAFLVRYASIYNYEMVGYSEGVDSFSDQDTISSYAVDAVDTMRQLGILQGRPAADGGYYFDPRANATRAECAAVFRRLSGSLLPYTGRELIDPEGLSLTPTEASLYPGQSMSLVTTVYPEDATNKTITWFSTNPDVISVEPGGRITALAEGTADVYAMTWNGYSSCTTVTSQRNPAFTYAGQSYEEKCLQIFGEVVSDPRQYYQSAVEAQSHMVEIAVKCWDYSRGVGSGKVTVTRYLMVHENIAATVSAIFDEIYNGSEKFPIHAVGCYRWETGSEHMPGLAIDINPDSNYFCNPDGSAIVGSHWDPENDPYSIPLNGDVENAFSRYGFTRGIYWRNGTKDYMHFSLFGT